MTIDEFVLARAHDEGNEALFAVGRLHIPAACGRHCSGHLDETPMWPCLELRAVAYSYSDHSDYREEWRP